MDNNQSVGQRTTPWAQSLRSDDYRRRVAAPRSRSNSNSQQQHIARPRQSKHVTVGEKQLVAFQREDSDALVAQAAAAGITPPPTATANKAKRMPLVQLGDESPMRQWKNRLKEEQQALEYYGALRDTTKSETLVAASRTASHPSRFPSPPAAAATLSVARRSIIAAETQQHRAQQPLWVEHPPVLCPLCLDEFVLPSSLLQNHLALCTESRRQFEERFFTSGSFERCCNRSGSSLTSGPSGTPFLRALDDCNVELLSFHRELLALCCHTSVARASTARASTTTEVLPRDLAGQSSALRRMARALHDDLLLQCPMEDAFCTLSNTDGCLLPHYEVCDHIEACWIVRFQGAVLLYGEGRTTPAMSIGEAVRPVSAEETLASLLDRSGARREALKLAAEYHQEEEERNNQAMRRRGASTHSSPRIVLLREADGRVMPTSLAIGVAWGCRFTLNVIVS